MVQTVVLHKETYPKVKELENKRPSQCIATSAARTVAFGNSNVGIDNDKRKGTNFARRCPQSRNDTHDQIDYSHDYYGPGKTDNSTYGHDMSNNDGMNTSKHHNDKPTKNWRLIVVNHFDMRHVK